MEILELGSTINELVESVTLIKQRKLPSLNIREKIDWKKVNKTPGTYAFNKRSVLFIRKRGEIQWG